MDDNKRFVAVYELVQDVAWHGSTRLSAVSVGRNIISSIRL